ncbi:MAG: thioredoxin domain-containing protein [Flavobacteriaceae bacterium]
MKNFSLILVLCFLFGCKEQAKKYKYTNALIKETSPYLLQHAHNPVNWHPWSQETLALAKKENKLILISIGYSSCHWCHVMEEESFKDEEVADIMNKNFINIKVDREERPDIDKIYLNAVQLMTGSGGWPLNSIALPDGKPVWGGTYFNKENWISSITKVAELYKENPQKIIKFAAELTKGIKQSDLVPVNNSTQNFSLDSLKSSIAKWTVYFDKINGGLKGESKFPMPNNLNFLQRYAHQTKDSLVQSYLDTTLTKIAYGGIFDQIGGGFSRYAVDSKWHIPHFEKMLFDNALLVSLYSNAYLAKKNNLYKEKVYETLRFVERELTNPKGGFYSSLNADSFDSKKNLEEGAFYVWTHQELRSFIKEDFKLFADYYNIKPDMIWEHDKYVLYRTKSDVEFAAQNNISIRTFVEKKTSWNAILLKERNKRIRPSLDDKILTSWNALMIKGYIDAFRVFNDQHFLDAAIKNIQFLEEKVLKENGKVFRKFKNQKASIDGYLEDYAILIDMYISVYQVTFKEQWLQRAKKLTTYSFKNFFDEKTKLFFFTTKQNDDLITRKIETEDNVIASSNSIMANNLFMLSHYFDNKYYLQVSKQMLHNLSPLLQEYPSSYANWMNLYLNFAKPFYEVAISGKDALKKTKELNKYYIPNKLLCGSKKESSLPLLKNRFVKEQTLLYVCVNKACKLPTVNALEASKQLIED